MPKQWFLAAVVMSGLTGSGALAQTVIDSGPPLNPTPAASFQATVNYDASLSQLQFDFVNTSPFDNGGFFTGFVFNVPAGAVVTYTDVNPGQSFDAIHDVLVAPYGTFGAGAALGSEFFNGGSADNGLFPTESQTFFFDVTIGGSAAGTLVNLDSFLSLTGEGGSVPASIVARFRDFESGDDQLAPVLSQTPPIIPLPMAAWSALSGMGMLVVPMAWRRVRRKA